MALANSEGASPPFRCQDSIARAKPALEAEHRKVGDRSRASCLISSTASWPSWEPRERLVDQAPRIAQRVGHAVPLPDELGLEHPAFLGLWQLRDSSCVSARHGIIVVCAVRPYGSWPYVPMAVDSSGIRSRPSRLMQPFKISAASSSFPHPSRSARASRRPPRRTEPRLS